MMYRYAKSIGKDVSARADLSVYPDVDKVSDYAREAMEWAVAIKMVQGDGGLLNPQGKSNRAVCATIITRFMEKFGENEGDKTDEGDDSNQDDGSGEDGGVDQGDESGDGSNSAGENGKGDVSGENGEGNQDENNEGSI